LWHCHRLAIFTSAVAGGGRSEHRETTGHAHARQPYAFLAKWDGSWINASERTHVKIKLAVLADYANVSQEGKLNIKDEQANEDA